jgi:hypothetical protein
MGMWVEGWIEVRLWHNGPEDEDSWQAVVDVGSLTDDTDTISELLFGLSKARACLDHDTPPGIFEGRGKPAHVSRQIRSDWEAIRLHEDKYGPGEIDGYTSANWAELAAVRPNLPDLAESDWRRVLDLMAVLAEGGRYPADRVRIVVWYSW